MMASNQWYYRLDGRPHGPFTVVQFEKLIRGNTILLGTEVSSDGKTWRALRDVLACIPLEEPLSPSSSDWSNSQTLIPSESSLPSEVGTDKRNQG
jgi:hypothetical protein